MRGRDEHMTVREQHVLSLANEIGPLKAFQQLTAENDALIRQPTLDNGREIACERTAIYTALVHAWVERERRAFGYDKPFALVALGGTGRNEMTPCSDNDFAFFFEGTLEDNPFLKHLQGQILHRGEFSEAHGFKCEALPFTLSDVPNLDAKQLNSFLDMRAVYDPEGLTGIFRDRIRATYDPFDQFLHLLSTWTKVWEPASWLCERLDAFDIKNEGLRIFLAGIWTLATERFQPSWEIYESAACRAKDLAAYAFLLRIRGIVQLRHPNMAQNVAPGSHPEDVLGFEDFTSFGELLGEDASELERYDFANGVRAQLLSARRRVGRFARGIIQTALRTGRPVKRGGPIVLGSAGLHYRPPKDWSPDNEEKSRAALSLLLASQRYGLEVDPSEVHATFLDIGDWLEPVPELAELFYEERGSLAKVFTFLAGTDGAEERLFTGYARFEASLDGRVVDEKRSLRGALERQKIQILEKYVREGKLRLVQAVSEAKLRDLSKNLSVEVEAALLGADELAAIKLALKTKRLPVTPDDLQRRSDADRPLHERLSTGISGIPLEKYYDIYGRACGFSEATLNLTRFLVRNRRAFRVYARVGYNADEQVARFVHLCRTEVWLRALFVFTQADQAEWQPADVHPAHSAEGFNVRELYVKAMAAYHPAPDMSELLSRAGFTSDHLGIFEDLRGVFSGAYRELSHRFCYHLIELAENPNKGPLVRVIWVGPSTIIGVAARDYRGLAASITGALAGEGIPLLQAHLFSASRYGLALDFFHVSLPARSVGSELSQHLEEVILEKRLISDREEDPLAPLQGEIILRPWDDKGRYQLLVAAPDRAKGLIHTLTYRIYRYLGANIFGLSAYSVHGTAHVSIYHDLPQELSLEEARTIVAEKFAVSA